MPARPITFLSDYGYEDEFAGVCRAVIARIAPQAPLIDLTHGVPAHDVRRGAFALAAALPHAPEGVHLAVVDPGVGTTRRALAVSTGGEGRVLVGPDNGLLWPALERLGGPNRAFDLGRSPFRIDPVSATFHGRDLFAPVAAHLASGRRLEQAGEEIDPATLARIAESRPLVRDDHVVAHVAYLDRFGNAVLDLPAAMAPAYVSSVGRTVRLGIGDAEHELLRARTFGDAAPGQALLYEDATGALAIAVNRGSAAAALSLAVDDEVLLRPSR